MKLLGWWRSGVGKNINTMLRQVSVNRHALDLARQATGLFEIADQWLRAIREQRVVLDVGAGNETGKQIACPALNTLP